MSKGLLTLAGVLLASTTAAVAQTQTVEAPNQRVTTTFPVGLTFGGPLTKVVSDGATAANAALRAPAAPLTRELVYAVGSTQYGGWEYMTEIGQQNTVGDHGGAQMRVVVQEIGHGNTPLAWMLEVLLPLSANYQNDAICISNGYYVSPCPVGSIVVGYYRYYNVDGWFNGWFTYQNTSTNSPWNTLLTSMYIQ
jgi:hypothetical protein